MFVAGTTCTLNAKVLMRYVPGFNIPTWGPFFPWESKNILQSWKLLHCTSSPRSLPLGIDSPSIDSTSPIWLGFTEITGTLRILHVIGFLQYSAGRSVLACTP